jgi:hypothetical protein
MPGLIEMIMIIRKSLRDGKRFGLLPEERERLLGEIKSLKSDARKDPRYKEKRATHWIKFLRHSGDDFSKRWDHRWSVIRDRVIGL